MKSVFYETMEEQLNSPEKRAKEIKKIKEDIDKMTQEEVLKFIAKTLVDLAK